MSYTNIELVRQHLMTPYPINDTIADQPVRLIDDDWMSFFTGAVDAESVRVKVVKAVAPVRVAATLGEQPVVFSATSVVPGVIVVASDSSLGRVYTENRDYIVDHSGGAISIKSDGVLGSGDTVVIWYLPYSLYQAGVDYSLDAAQGRIKRLLSGGIAAGETVMIDYAPLNADVSEELLVSAVAMANGMVETEIDPNRQFETNTLLEAAATFRALEIVCRAAAGRELARPGCDEKAALAWLKLAENYGGRADAMLNGFHPPFNDRHAPVRV